MAVIRSAFASHMLPGIRREWVAWQEELAAADVYVSDFGTSARTGVHTASMGAPPAEPYVPLKDRGLPEWPEDLNVEWWK